MSESPRNPTRGDSAPFPTEEFERLREALQDQYEIGEEVGRGGTAHVFRARDLREQRDVALKLLRPEFAAAVTKLRFLREIELVSNLEHPNVLPLLDSGSAGGQVYFTMPLLKGRTLRDHVQENGALPIDQVIAISRDIASALDYAHTKGVIHRDIKPSNTLLEDGRTYVMDFGIARAVRVASGDELTDSGVSIGTPEYMSPEQGMGSRQLDGRCDVYSLGCVVYHMLSGAPPFTGPTSQAIIARHCIETPPPLHVVRPTISEETERIVERALAKIPADRFATAGEFVSALEGALNAPPVARRKVTRRRATIAAAIASMLVLTSVAALWFAPPGNDTLDLNRIVVFPLTTSGLAAGELSGDDLATAIGFTLEGTQPLRWLLGRELLDNASLSDTTRVTTSAARRLSRKAGAGYFIDGKIIWATDSVTVALQLWSVAEDTVIARSILTEARGAFIRSLGLKAVTRLMAALIQPKAADVSQLGNREPASLLNFLQAEREYRSMQFSAALAHYKKAVGVDASFALAALRGAQSADWLSSSEDSALVEVALSNESSLSLLQRMIARGLRAYVIGNADSAVYYFERALTIEPASAQTWTMLGEVYARMLPSRGPADSLSEHAFLRARELDADFAPALLHLERLAFGRGDLAAVRRFGAELKSASADSSHAFERDLMTRCLRQRMSAADWSEAVRREVGSVLEAGKIFSAGAKQPICARAALQALLRADTSSRANYRSASLRILHGVYDALAYSPNAEEIGARVTDNFPLWTLSALHDGNTPELRRIRRRALDSLGANYATLRIGDLWYLSLIALRLGDTATLASIQRVVKPRADSTGARTDKLVAAEGSARLSLLVGDTTEAIEKLQALKPTARRNDLTWLPWESLGAERMMLAELLLARGEARRAIDVATLIDAPQPFAYLYWLRSSLQLRARAADQLQDARLAKRYRGRLSQLDVKAAELSRAGKP